MNALTKLALAFLVVFVAGLLAICWGFGRFHGGAAIVGGIVVCVLGVVGFAVTWRAR